MLQDQRPWETQDLHLVLDPPNQNLHFHKVPVDLDAPMSKQCAPIQGIFNFWSLLVEPPLRSPPFLKNVVVLHTLGWKTEGNITLPGDSKGSKGEGGHRQAGSHQDEGSLAGQVGAAAGQTGLNAHGRHLTDQLRARTPGLGPAVPHTL